MNLSSKVLNQGHLKALTLGLKFIPKPRSVDYPISSSFQAFRRRILLQYFFHNKKGKPKVPFTEPSEWTPPLATISDKLLDHLDKLEAKLNKICPKKKPLNQPHKESLEITKAIKHLKSLQPDTIFKPCDKGSSIVLMDLKDYIGEVNRQLTNKLHYKAIKDFVSPQVTPIINNILTHLKNDGYLTDKQVKYLSPPDPPRKRYFYLLPKIHKERSKWNVINGHKFPPGRPIVSDINSDTYKLSEYIDYHLQKVAHRHPSYLKDTPDFISKLKLTKASKHAYLISLDVEGLYTNIDNQAGIEAIRKLFKQYPDHTRPDEAILALLELSLKNNDFEFFHKTFLQIWGTAMGKKFAPQYADAFLAIWESEVMKLVKLKPSLYLRFLDDIFIIWEHSLQDFQEFLTTLNNHKETIKLKPTISQESIDFLDVTVFKGPRFQRENILDTKVFFKPTDTHELLHKTSYHPQHTFSGILKSQFLRFFRISNNFSDYLKASQTLIKVLATRNYSRSLLRKILRETTHQLIPLDKTTNKRCKDPKCIVCPKHLLITSHIVDPRLNYYQFNKELTCESTNLVYAIKCTYCNLFYVGQTSLTLKERFSCHKSSLNTNKDTQLNQHFRDLFHPSIHSYDFIQIIPLQQLPILEDKTLNKTSLLNAETRWINRLDTINKGLNSQKSKTSPIPFVSQFNDKSKEIKECVSNAYQDIQKDFPKIFKNPLLMSYQRNDNIKDLTISTIEPSHPDSNKHTDGNPVFLPVANGPQEGEELLAYYTKDYSPYQYQDLVEHNPEEND